MRSKFDEQLAELNKEMVRMGNMIEQSIAKAVNVFYNRDVPLAKKIMEEDYEVNQAQKRIETICFNLLIQQQPVARDLRTITAAMKMVTDIERIGDHAADIAEMTILMSSQPPVENMAHINKMASEAVMMLNWSIEAYVNKDVQKAREVIERDNVVDELFVQNKKDIIKVILNNPGSGEQVIDLLMVAKYFERIGDHATNIAEWVIYALDSQPMEEENGTEQ
ncbi:MAG: phosphate signaling complex protein PhoU [Lachnospiraceae bacterium]